MKEYEALLKKSNLVDFETLDGIREAFERYERGAKAAGIVGEEHTEESEPEACFREMRDTIESHN
jgi:hypothetical protein